MRIKTQLAEIAVKLDRIIELLDLQTLPPGPEETPPCPHEIGDDIGTMGMKPGERMKCRSCGEIYQRLEGEQS